MSTLQDHIESINCRLSDKYDRICDERSRKRFELLLRDIEYEMDETERREMKRDAERSERVESCP